MNKLVAAMVLWTLCFLPTPGNCADLTRKAAEAQIKKAFVNVGKSVNLLEGDFLLYGHGWEVYQGLESLGYLRANVLGYSFYRTGFLPALTPYVLESSSLRTFTNGLGRTTEQRYTENKVLLWRLKYDRITGIKKTTNSFSDCGAEAIFAVTVDKAPFVSVVAQANTIPADRLLLSACFAEYDDGWRLEKINLPNWVGVYDNALGSYDARKAKAGTPKPAKLPVVRTHTGRVIKVLNAGGYTYINYEEDGKKKWMGGMETPVRPGDTINFDDSEPMRNYVSKSLGMEFDELIMAPEIRVKKNPSKSSYDFVGMEVEELSRLMETVFKAKIEAACGGAERCVAVVSNYGVQKARSIKEALAMAGDGDVVWIGAGEYREVIELRNRKNLVIIGSNASIVTDRDEGIIGINYSENITITGLHVVHKIGKYCAHDCIDIYESKGVRIIDNDIDGSGYVGVSALNSEKIEIAGNLIHNCEYGVYAHADKENTITLVHNTFLDNRKSNIDVSNVNIFRNDYLADNYLDNLKPRGGTANDKEESEISSEVQQEDQEEAEQTSFAR